MDRERHYTSLCLNWTEYLKWNAWHHVNACKWWMILSRKLCGERSNELRRLVTSQGPRFENMSMTVLKITPNAPLHSITALQSLIANKSVANMNLWFFFKNFYFHSSAGFTSSVVSKLVGTHSRNEHRSRHKKNIKQAAEDCISLTKNNLTRKSYSTTVARRLNFT